MKYPTFLKRKRGFTLVEMVVYTTIVAIIFVVAVNTILLTSAAWGSARVKRNILNQGNAALERMLREIRLADSINTGGSTFGVNPGILYLNTVVGAGDETPATREFFVSASSTIMRENAVESSLTGGITVASLVFYRVVNGDTSEAVTIRMTLQDGDGRFLQSENFYGTAVLRRSY